MNQKLFKQIKNEWRSNLWLCLELLVVSVVMWYIVDYLYVQCRVYTEPLGFDISHCYKISINEITDKSPEYIDDPTDEQRGEWIIDMQERLRRRPEIEYVALGQNAHPYNNSNSGRSFRFDTLYANGFYPYREVTPDFMNVFRYEGVNGETPEQLAEMLRKGEILVSDNLLNQLDDKQPSMSQFIGTDAYEYNDSTKPCRVGASIVPVKYSDFMQGQMNRTVVMGLPEYAWWAHELVVRVRDGMDKDFIENLRADADRHFRVGNLFISDIQSFDDMRENFLQGEFISIRNMVTGMAFLLLNIFLGLLGTFWFRTQQRTRDIAVRKVSGATSSDVFRLLIGEGLLLLAVVTLPAVVIDANLANLEFNQWYAGSYFSIGRILLCAAITFLIMALMIVVGIAIPAWRAMHVTPATALHDE